jgi:ribose 5-phosphate isomerase RpiB
MSNSSRGRHEAWPHSAQNSYQDAHTMNAVTVLLNKLNNCSITFQLTGAGIRISAKGIPGLIVAAMAILLLLLLKWLT